MLDPGSTAAATRDLLTGGGAMPGTKSYRPWSPEQPFLMPPSPGEWLPEDHIARFVLELVRELDITAIETTIQSKDPRG